jgi:hypothetical protein
LHRHAATVDAVRAQLAAVTEASRAIAQDDAAYGVLCGWISAILERRHAGQDHLYAYAAENLRLMSEALTTTGDEYDAVDRAAQSRIRAAGGVG